MKILNENANIPNIEDIKVFLYHFAKVNQSEFKRSVENLSSIPFFQKSRFLQHKIKSKINFP